MKYFLFLAILFFAGNTFGQLTAVVSWTDKSNMPAAEVIYYDTRQKLDWNDFAGTPPVDKGLTAALTVSGFGYNASMKSRNDKGELSIAVYCYFKKDKSWVKPGKNTAYILTHEQHHFDVSYIAAAVFIEKLKAAQFTTSNYNVLLPKIYTEACDLMNKMQNDYDGETKNGQLKDEQSRWNALLDAKLDATTNSR